MVLRLTDQEIEEIKNWLNSKYDKNSENLEQTNDEFPGY